MIGKLLLTLAVLLGAYAVLRVRWRSRDVAKRSRDLPASPGAPRALRTAAGVVLGIMLAGSLFVVLQGWLEERQVMVVEVLDAAGGSTTLYRARRRDIDGRRIRTLDGAEIRVADVERMIVRPASAAPRR